MAKKNNIRLAMTALGKRIMAGYPNKAGTGFVGEPDDVTSDVFKVVAEKVGVGMCTDVMVEGKHMYRIAIVALYPDGRVIDKPEDIIRALTAMPSADLAAE